MPSSQHIPEGTTLISPYKLVRNGTVHIKELGQTQTKCGRMPELGMYSVIARHHISQDALCVNCVSE